MLVINALNETDFFALLFPENKFLNALGIKGLTERAIYSAMKEWKEKPASDLCPGLRKKITWSFSRVMGK